jgi:hypothetical protein
LFARRWAAILASAATAALGLGTAACGGSSSSSSSTPTTGQRATPVAVTVSQLRAIAKNAGHPLYWIGPAPPGATLELTTIADGRSYLRYLPQGVQVGTAQRFLTIGTYTQPVVALPSVRAAAAKRHALTRALPGGGLAVQYPNIRQSVYLAFPGAHYLVEVFDPSPAKALRLATTGKVVPIS